MNIIFPIIHYGFLTYTILLFVRILGSWIPNVQQYKWMRFVCYYTDPYLNIFRKIIPPIGGVLDLSPILAFLGLRLMEYVLLFLMLSIVR